MQRLIIITLVWAGLMLVNGPAAEAQANRILVDFPTWDWEISIAPSDAAGNPVGEPVDIALWGTATVAFDDSQVDGGLGTVDDPRPLPATEEPVVIPIDIVALSLTSIEPVQFPGFQDATVMVRLANDNRVNDNHDNRQGQGLLSVQNQNGFLVGDSFFNVFVELEVQDANTQMLFTANPALQMAMTFDTVNRIPAIDVFWLPGWVWLQNRLGSTLPLTLLRDVTNTPWDVVVDLHGFFTPEVDCVETVNPHGKRVPPAGRTTLPGPKGGQNEDGFYQLLVRSEVPQLIDMLDLFVTDAAGSGPFGPFNSGDRVKITEAPGAAATSKKIGSNQGQAGAIMAHITLQGDAILNAVDPVGNVFSTTCFVPPPPK